MTATKLPDFLDALRAHHGRLSPPTAAKGGAFELILWERIAYLATDEKRELAIKLLRRKIGLTPQKILIAAHSSLVEIAKIGGIAASQRADQMIEAAQIVVGEFDGDLDRVCKRPLVEAKRQLKRFHGIGDPGAEKILLFTRSHAVLGLDSNGLRVLTRAGWGVPGKTYGATYKSATSAAVAELGADTDRLIDAHLLLRRHGQTVCKASAPKCGVCVVRDMCNYGRRQMLSGSLSPAPSPRPGSRSPRPRR